MSYTPTNWKTGDVVTSEKLNKLENGVATAGGVLVVNASESGMLDHTWQEIADNKFAILNGPNGAVYYLVQISSNPYAIVFLNLATTTPTPSIFIAESADGYPVYSDNGNGNGSGSGT